MNNLQVKFLKIQDRLKSPQFNKMWIEKCFYTAKNKIMAEMPDYDLYLAAKSKAGIEGVSAPYEFKFMYQEPLLSKPQEQHLFRKYNYLKFRFNQIVKSTKIINVTEKKIDNLEDCWLKIQKLKEQSQNISQFQRP